jgi:hypothetical protein
MRLWSFGAVDAEHARLGSAFARATVDACAITTGKERADPMPYMPRIGGATWQFGDQERSFLAFPTIK